MKKGDNIRLDAYYWVGSEDPRIAPTPAGTHLNVMAYMYVAYKGIADEAVSAKIPPLSCQRALRDNCKRHLGHEVDCCVPTKSTMSLRQETVALRTSAMRARTCCPLDTLRPHLGHHTFQQNLSATVLEDLFFCVLRGTQRTLTGRSTAGAQVLARIPKVPRHPYHSGPALHCCLPLRAVDLSKSDKALFVVVEYDLCDLAFCGAVVLSCLVLIKRIRHLVRHVISLLVSASLAGLCLTFSLPVHHNTKHHLDSTIFKTTLYAEHLFQNLYSRQAALMNRSCASITGVAETRATPFPHLMFGICCAVCVAHFSTC